MELGCRISAFLLGQSVASKAQKTEDYSTYKALQIHCSLAECPVIAVDER